MENFVGLDLGTTGVRAVVFDGNARQLGEATEEYPLHTPHPGWAEQDPAEVVPAALRCLGRAAQDARLGKGARVAVGVSGTFHSVLPLDERGEPLGRALIWADTRAGEEAAAIREHHDVQKLYERTGCPVHPMYLPAKIRWLRQNTPAARAFRSIKEQVLLRLAGVAACDLSVASGTGLLNLDRKSWDDELLSIAGVEPGQLGELCETTATVGTITRETAEATGLHRESVVVAGAGDGVLSSLGAGAIDVGQMTATIGTSGAVRLVADRPKVDRRARTWCYYLAEDRWVAGAAINNAGIAFRWAAEKLLRAGDRGYDHVASWAEAVGPGADGLLFLPFLTGERAPYWNADARGVLFGLAIGHDHRHVARATLEGICFRMRSCYEALAEVAGPVREVRATGGFTKTPFWLQLLADVLQQPLAVPSVQEVSALGAAELAMVALGTMRLDDAKGRVELAAPIEPDQSKAGLYARLYDLYMQVYWRLTDQFAEIARLQRGG